MKQKRFSETQIIQILKQAEGGIPVATLSYKIDSSIMDTWHCYLNQVNLIEGVNGRLKISFN